MRYFEYEENARKLLDLDILQFLSVLHEHRGRQDLYVGAKQDELSSLMEIAKIQSTKSSNGIEGIFTTDKRLNELMQQKAEPRNRNEKEISGYRDVLNTIYESYDYISLTPNLIRQFHRDLYAYEGSNFGGNFKSSDNIIAEQRRDGSQKVRFVPVSAFETEEAMNRMCEAFLSVWKEDKVDRLLLIPMFVLDFLCIHPFDDGNGRMSRLLTLLLLYQAGMLVGKYISVEMIIEQTRETYYQVLEDGSAGWHQNANDYGTFVRYFLGILIKASREFEDRAEHLAAARTSKPQRVEKIVRSTVGKVSKREILEKCPDISTKTVERTLAELLKNGLVEKVGSGPATAYVWRGD